MPIPGNINTITLTGTYLDMAGNARTGTVQFAPSTPLLVDPVSLTVFGGAPVTEALSGGQFSVTLPCTDNLNPSGWSWTVTESVSGGPVRTYSVLLPHTLGSTVDISTLTPVTSPATVSPYLLVSQLAQDNGPAQLNGSGLLPVTQGGTGAGTASAALAALGGFPADGGELTGPLVISDVPSPSGTLPVGYGTSTAVTGLQVISSYPSDDVIGGTDGTGRINLYSYQRANTNSFGETLRNFLMRWDAKAMTAWYGPVSLYDGSGNAIGTGGWKPWVWAGAHYESNSHDSVHGHWELEVPDSSGAMQGRFAVPFANTSTGTIGLDLATIYTNLSNFHIYCQGTTALGAYQEQFLRLTAPAGYEKALEWNNDGSPAATLPRWRMAATADAESGGNAGTNWALYRYSDGGTLLGTAIEIVRSTGQVMHGASILVGATTSLGSGGVGVIEVANAATPPSANPAGGGVLYASGGLPEWLASDGGTYPLAPPAGPLPSDFGYAAWTADPMSSPNSQAPSAGVLHVTRFQVRNSKTVTKVIIGVVSTSGMSLTTGENFVGIYNSAGTQVAATADITSSVASGELVLALTSSMTLTPGYYWAGILLNGTTMPTLARGPGSISGFGNSQTTGAKRWGTYGSAQTALPATITVASIANDSTGGSYWAAVA